MYNKPSEISSLISARICHDLAGPLGAISNGMELLELTGLADTPETALINDSIVAAKARVEFFRVAYARADANALVSPKLAQKILSEHYAGTKLQIRWATVADAPRPTCKLLFLLIQCIDSSLPYGGKLEISEAANGYTISCAGREIRLSEPLWKLVTNGEFVEDIGSRQIQFALAYEQATSTEKSIQIAQKETELTVHVTAN